MRLFVRNELELEIEIGLLGCNNGGRDEREREMRLIAKYGSRKRRAVGRAMLMRVDKMETMAAAHSGDTILLLFLLFFFFFRPI